MTMVLALPRTLAITTDRCVEYNEPSQPEARDVMNSV